MAKTPRRTNNVRDRILKTASELFYREGTRAVGVDLIVERSAVAKTSLYRYFRTKDDLIEAFLLGEDDDFWKHWDSVAASHEGAPEREFAAQLKWIGERIARPEYRGCPQINVSAEYADPNHPARKVAVAHKTELRRRLRALARAMRLRDPNLFALQMAIVIDGALSSGNTLHREGPVNVLTTIAETLKAAQSRPAAARPSRQSR